MVLKRILSSEEEVWQNPNWADINFSYYDHIIKFKVLHNMSNLKIQTMGQDTNGLFTKNTGITIDGVDYQFAGFWIRLTAAIIDLTMLSLITVPLTIIFFLIAAPLVAIAFGEQHNSINILEPENPLFLLANLGLLMLITIFFWSRFSATPAKMLFNIQVIDSETLRKPTMIKSVQRFLSYFLLLFPIGIYLIAIEIAFHVQIISPERFRKPIKPETVHRTLHYFLSLFPAGISFIAVAFNPEKQGFHDMTAGTYVIKKMKPSIEME